MAMSAKCVAALLHDEEQNVSIGKLNSKASQINNCPGVRQKIHSQDAINFNRTVLKG
jgi:hypothetical protein